ncbi:MAG: lysophospholipid acyltransferase family protein [Candidatus Aminicenantes bacterium]
MPTYEEEYHRLFHIVARISSFALLGKKVIVKGKENFVKIGPNIIVGNHIGSFKDIAALVEIVPRPMFFIANQMIFNKKELNFLIRKHLKRNLKDFGLAIDLILRPLKTLFVNFITENIPKVGTIPVDIYQGKKQAIKKCQEYLEKGRTIIALQGRGRIMKGDPHPYVHEFRKGASIMSYNLYTEKSLSVPVTPLAFFGTHKSFVTPAKVKVNVGEPMYIADYMEKGFLDTINRFSEAMEERVKSLFYDLIKA